MDFVHGESVSKMDWITIGEVTYTEDGVYVNGKLVFANDAWYIEPPDYVDVTRCRDCKYYIDPEDEDLKPYCTNTFEGTAITPNTRRWVKPDGFCAWAERKEK